jgi:hypothetical protein
MIPSAADDLGFYFIASKEYSSHLLLMHSHYKEELLKINRGVEPGVTYLFDLHVFKEDPNDLQRFNSIVGGIDTDYEGSLYTIRVLSTRE